MPQAFNDIVESYLLLSLLYLDYFLEEPKFRNTKLKEMPEHRKVLAY